MNTNEKNEYEVINLGYEYPGMTGGVKWAVVTNLSQDELNRKYGSGNEEFEGDSQNIIRRACMVIIGSCTHYYIMKILFL